jgi:hypothetical protein
MWNFSTGCKNALLGASGAVCPLALTAATLSFQEGTGAGGRDRIADSGNGLIGFAAYDYYWLTVSGSTSNDGTYLIHSAAAGYIEVAVGSFSTEAAGDQVILSVVKGGSMSDVFRNCYIDLYSGSRPANADLIAAGTKLCRITLNGADFVVGSPGNGINLGQVSGGTISSMIDQVTGATQALKGIGLVTGAAQFARVYANNAGATNIASASEIRMDGRVSTSGVEVNMSAGTTVTKDVYATVTSVSMSL